MTNKEALQQVKQLVDRSGVSGYDSCIKTLERAVNAIELLKGYTKCYWNTFDNDGHDFDYCTINGKEIGWNDYWIVADCLNDEKKNS